MPLAVAPVAVPGMLASCLAWPGSPRPHWALLLTTCAPCPVPPGSRDLTTL